MTAIAIFVKTPGLSPLKTRLAESIGQTRATSLYQSCAATVAEAASFAAVGRVYWATAESPREARATWQGFPHIAQGEGGLGERMHRVLGELVDRHGSGLLLGADAPQLEPAVLKRASEWLARGARTRTIGPARDGGFWTFGANHVPARELWTQVSYSRPDTLEAFRDALGMDAEWLELPMLNDLDTAEDLDRIANELQRLPEPLPAQSALLDQLIEAQGTNPKFAAERPEP